jgi:hypothetical protein
MLCPIGLTVMRVTLKVYFMTEGHRVCGHEENNLEEEETVMPPLIKYLNSNQHGIRGYFSNLLQLQQLMFKIMHHDISVYFPPPLYPS